MLSFYTTILKASIVTVSISLLSMIFGLLLGSLLALLEMNKSKISYIFNIFSALVRSLPDILIIFFVDYIFQEILTKFHINSNPFISGLLSLSLIVSAFSSQIFIAAYNSIPKNHIHIANSMKLNKLTTFKHIIAPQVLHFSLPALLNLTLVILKDSSIVSLIGLNDMMNAAHIASADTFNPFNYYAFAALIYLIMSWIIIQIQKWFKVNDKCGELYA